MTHPFESSLPRATPRSRSMDSPWVPLLCFLVMTLSNALLSYFRLSLSIDILILCFGLVIPVLLAANLNLKEANEKNLFSIPGWFYMAAISAFLFFRLYRLTSLSTWPIVDEGVFGYFATLLERKWDWQLTHGYAQEPVLYTWGQFLFFKVFGNSLFSIWLFPAICSALALPLAWGAVSKTKGSSLAFLVFCFMGLGYWPLYLGRISVQSALMVPWEWLVFWLLAQVFLNPKPHSLLPILLLSIFTALGFYIYLAWPLVAFMVFVALLFQTGAEKIQRSRNLTLFILVQLVLVSTLALVYWNGHADYFAHLWFPSSQVGWLEKLGLPWAYLKSIFWGQDASNFSHGPLWGGLLNPLMTTCFIWGLIGLLGSQLKPLQSWVLLSLFIFFLPAFLTNNFELTRLAPLLPLLVLVCAQGASILLGLIPKGTRVWVLLVFLSCSCSVDAHHLFQIYPPYWAEHPAYYGDQKTPEFYRAYNLLKPISNLKGPGWILLNFNPDPYDQTLFVTSFQFNSAENPGLDPSRSQWAAILTNIHEQPSLKRMFPEGQWTWLSQGLNRSDGGFMLETLPLTSSNRAILNRWKIANQGFSELTYSMMDRGVVSDQNPLLHLMDKVYPIFQGDPLLESRYWRIRALHHLAGGNWAAATEDYQEALAKGVPQAQLYDELGKLEWKAGNKDEAEKNFKAAVACRLNLTDAQESLNVLESRKETAAGKTQ